MVGTTHRGILMEKLFKLIHKELVKILTGEISDKDLLNAKSYATGRYQIGAQTVGQISDYYADGYFTNGTIEKYSNLPTLVKNITKDEIVKLAREFISSNINAMVAVSSVEKALIIEMAEQLKFD